MTSQETRGFKYLQYVQTGAGKWEKYIEEHKLDWITDGPEREQIRVLLNVGNTPMIYIFTETNHIAKKLML